MKIITIREETIEEGATIDQLKLANGMIIPALTVGEEGRGRKLAAVPVQLRRQSYEEWTRGSRATIRYGRLEQTKSGRPKIVEEEKATDSSLLLVLRTPIGFRGHNVHVLPEGTKTIANGIIAQGCAGRVGRGDQLIVLVPEGIQGEIIVRIRGRRYGRPSEYIYQICNGEIRLKRTDKDPVVDIEEEDVRPI